MNRAQTQQTEAVHTGSLELWAPSADGPTGRAPRCRIDKRGREYASQAEVLLIEPANTEVANSALLSHALAVAERHVEEGKPMATCPVAVWANRKFNNEPWYRALTRVHEVKGWGRHADATLWDERSCDTDKRQLHAGEPMRELWAMLRIQRGKNKPERRMTLPSEAGVGEGSHATIVAVVSEGHHWDMQSLAWWIARMLAERGKPCWEHAAMLAAHALQHAQAANDMRLALRLDTVLREHARGTPIHIEWNGARPATLHRDGQLTVSAVREDG